MSKLFVYGTLKSIGRSFSPWLRFGITAIDPTPAIVYGYSLYQSGMVGFPMARPKADEDGVLSLIQGELVTLSGDVEYALARLDRFEGVPHLYTREEVDVHIAGSKERAFMYVATEETIRGTEATEIGSFFSLMR